MGAQLERLGIMTNSHMPDLTPGNSFLLQRPDGIQEVATIKAVTNNGVTYELGPRLRPYRTNLAHIRKGTMGGNRQIVGSFTPIRDMTQSEYTEVAGPRVDLPLFGFSLAMKEVRALNQLLGGLGVNVIRGQGLPRERTYGIDLDELGQRYHKASPEVYGYDPTFISPELFHLSQSSGAVQAVIEAGKGIFASGREIDLYGDIKNFSSNPAEWLKILYKAGTNDRLIFEVTRHMLFTHIAGRVIARDYKDQEKYKLAAIQRLFTEQLFSGNGFVQEEEVESAHYPYTGTVAGISGVTEIPEGDFVIKKTPIEFRYVKGVGKVAGTERQKDLARSILKAIYAVKTTGNILNPDDAVMDKIGFAFAVQTEAAVNELANLIAKILRHQLGAIVYIGTDDKVGSDHGQSENINQKRLQIIMDGLYSRLEIQIMTIEEMLNRRYEVGRVDPKFQMSQGRGHKAFMDRRFVHVAPIIYPEDKYGRDLDEEKRRRSADTRRLLLMENTVDGWNLIEKQFAA